MENSYVILKLLSALASVLAALHVRSEGLHAWAGVMAVAAAGLLASYTWSWPSLIQWLTWAILVVVTTVGMGKAVRREFERKRK
ncbi:hypothetical protein DF026_17000 [Burkholderia stagnalis]|nr:hypothetical protein DF026_17000 [Burkholderia stagnalis]